MSAYLFNPKTQVTISVLLLVALIGGVWNLSAKATTVSQELGALRKSVDTLTLKIAESEREMTSIEKRISNIETAGSIPLREAIRTSSEQITRLDKSVDRLWSYLREHMARTGDATYTPKSGDSSEDNLWQQ